MPEPTKICQVCNLDDTQTEFYNHKRRYNGGALLKCWCKKCDQARMKAYRARDRLLALQAYGGEHPQCSCPGCEEDHLPFLSIDHIAGNGSKHRRELRAAQKRTKETFKYDRTLGSDVQPGGSAFFRWLRKNNYPDGYRVMCYNCNTARANGPCPVHETMPCQK